MKKKVLIVLFSVFVAGFYAQAQKVNVVSVSKERDIHNFYTMMKEAFPLAYNDPAAPRFIFFDDNKNFIFGVGGYVQLSGVYDFNGVEDYNFFTTSTIAMKGHQPGASYGMTVGQSRCRTFSVLYRNGIPGAAEHPEAPASFRTIQRFYAGTSLEYFRRYDSRTYNYR